MEVMCDKCGKNTASIEYRGLYLCSSCYNEAVYPEQANFDEKHPFIAFLRDVGLTIAVAAIANKKNNKDKK